MTNCRIRFLPSTDAEIQKFVKGIGSSSVTMIILSREMLALMKKDNIIYPKDNDFPMESMQMREILMKLKGKEFKKIMITFAPVSGNLHLLKDTQIFDLSLGVNGMRKDFEMNLSQILMTVTGNENLPRDWFSKERMGPLQNMISNIPVSDLTDSEDLLGISPALYPNRVMYKCPKQCPIPISEKCQQACQSCLEAYKCGFASKSRNQEGYMYSDFTDEGFESKGLTEASEISGLYTQDSFYKYPQPNVFNDFDPQGPDSDTESDSYTVLVQKQTEINRNYMSALSEEHCQGDRL